MKDWGAQSILHISSYPWLTSLKHGLWENHMKIPEEVRYPVPSIGSISIDGTSLCFPLYTMVAAWRKSKETRSQRGGREEKCLALEGTKRPTVALSFNRWGNWRWRKSKCQDNTQQILTVGMGIFIFFNIIKQVSQRSQNSDWVCAKVYCEKELLLYLGRMVHLLV